MNPQQPTNPPTPTPQSVPPVSQPSPMSQMSSQSSVPPPAGPEPPAKGFSKFTGFFGRHGKLLSVLAIAIVGTIATFASFAATPNNANNNSASYGFWWSERMQENFWDGQIHTSKTYCLNHSTVCHDNGSLVFLGGQNNAWQSDPAKNNKPGSPLTSATWYGGYLYSPGPQYVSVGTSITGNQQVCYQLHDVTSGSSSADVVFMVRNAAYKSGSINQPAKVLVSVSGQLASSFKKGFKPVCLPYYNPTTAFRQEYVIYVRSGTIQANYIDQLVQAYYYNPYIYQYSSVPGLSSAVKSSTTSCSGNITKSTNTCYSKKDLDAANPSKTLTNISTTPPATVD